MSASEEIFPGTFSPGSGPALPQVWDGGEFTVGEGIVRLAGRVVDEVDRELLEQCVRSAGARLYVDEVVVEEDEELRDSNDTRTAATAGAALLPHISVNDDYVRIRVNNRWVELDGDVEDYTLRETLGRIVRGLQGVTGLTNCLNVRAAVSVEELKTQVSDALDRVPNISAVR